MGCINYSEVESKRFGANIYRATLEELKPSVIRSEIVRSNVDVAILRIPSSLENSHSKLSNISNNILHADTLVYYSADLVGCEVKKTKNNLIFELVNESNLPSLKTMVPLIFKDYQNHYFSNPFFDRKKILEGYIEWACSYRDFNSGRVSWLVKKEGEMVGFATCSFDKKSKECVAVEEF